MSGRSAVVGDGRAHEGARAPSRAAGSVTVIWARGLALVAMVAGLFAVARIVFGPEPEFARRLPDDAFYYLGIARWVATKGVFSFDGGQTRTSGFHVLWMYLLLPLVRLAGRDERRLLALATGVSALVSLAVMAGGAAVFWRRRAAGALIALAMAVTGYAFLNGAASALEWPLCIACGAGLFALHARGDRDRPAVQAALFMTGVAGSLARSDFGATPFAVLAAALIVAVVAGRSSSVRPALAACAGAVVGLVLVLVHQHATSGSWVQHSALVEARWGEAAGWSIAPVLHQFARAVLFVPGLAHVGDRVGLKQQLGRTVVPWLVAALVAGLAVAVMLRRRIAHGVRTLAAAGWFASRDGFLFLSAVLTIGCYLALYSMNPVGVQYWYTAHVWVPGIVALAILIDAVLWHGGPAARRLLLVACTIIVVLNLGLFERAGDTFPWQAEGRRQGLEMARQRTLGTLEGPVAWADAGIVGFYEGGHVINLDGLANDEILGYLPDRLHCYLSAKHIRYTSNFGAAAQHFLHVPDMARFADPVAFTAPDGFKLWIFEVDSTRLAAFAECAAASARR